MPTNEPLDYGDDAGGPLNTIAQFTTTVTAAPAAAQPAAPYTAAAAHPAQPAQLAAAATHASSPVSESSAPAAAVHKTPTGRLRANIQAPGLRLRPTHEAKAADTPQTVSPQKPRMEEEFTEQQLEVAWGTFISNHNKEHLLARTMDSAHPRRVHGTFQLEMTVESDIQVDLIEREKPLLLEYLRRVLRNDSITLTAKANQGAPSPQTWNEREVLADMLKRHPGLQDLVKTFKLTLS